MSVQTDLDWLQINGNWEQSIRWKIQALSYAELNSLVTVFKQGYFILKIDLSCFKLKPQRRWA